MDRISICGPRGGLGEAIKPQTSVLVGALPAGIDTKESADVVSHPGQGTNKQGASYHYISSSLCNFSYEYDTITVKK
jgi:hypothetical protein